MIHGHVIMMVITADMHMRKCASVWRGVCECTCVRAGMSCVRVGARVGVCFFAVGGGGSTMVDMEHT